MKKWDISLKEILKKCNMPLYYKILLNVKHWATKFNVQC